jgi:hypothetical protein
MNHRRVLPALLAFAALTSGGCARKFVVITATPPGRGAVAPAEVLATDDYAPNLPKVKSVAVRFPNDCWKFEKGGGQVSAALTPSCAPWGEALVQSLAGAGFKVIGLQELLMLEAKQRMTPPAAAQLLGVNALIVVEKAETATVPLEEARRAKLVYTQADPDGTLQDPAVISEEGVAAISPPTASAPGVPRRSRRSRRSRSPPCCPAAARRSGVTRAERPRRRRRRRSSRCCSAATAGDGFPCCPWGWSRRGG